MPVHLTPPTVATFYHRLTLGLSGFEAGGHITPFPPLISLTDYSHRDFNKIIRASCSDNHHGLVITRRYR